MTLNDAGKNSDGVKLFNKWSFSELAVGDPGLKRYISIRPVFIPHSGGRHEHQRFVKSEVNIVEKLVNNMFRHGRVGGKKLKAINIVRLAFEIIHLKTEKNPIQVLIRAIENTAPCEDTTRIRYGGIAYHKAVDISPQRRMDLGLRFLSDGARNSAFSNKKSVEECLADELIAASERDSQSYAVQKKDEMERVALSSR